ncbi:MAG: protein kinase domain-containing protein [Gemmatimonadales bacterium]
MTTGLLAAAGEGTFESRDNSATAIMPVMDPDRWRLLEPLLDRALELPADERGRWLDELSAESPLLAADLTTLLSQESAADQNGFLAEPVDVDLAGTEFGAYTVERLLGQGGMGSVWLARRTDGRFEGRAAVKFLNLALLSPVGQERFRREGSALARLAHPGIARLLDAGVGAAGQPYLVLEYVDGRRIDDFVRERVPGLEDRIALFLQVLAAVGHAHANLIVHRDLKPSNILVTHDGSVKLLDFGIAKLLDAEGGAAGSALTLEGGSALTPAFAAPEQVLDQPITTATDVYALGVLLYLLLSGRHPTAGEHATPADAIRTLIETDPERLGRGDLDNILGKALRKAPAERYQTVAAFADDLRRYLRQEPVSARRDSLAYRGGRFLRRNRAAVMLGAIMVVGLPGATVFSVEQMQEARRQRDAAVHQRQRADAQVEFQGFLMSQVSDRPITMREIVDRGRALLEQEYAADPRFLGAILLQLSQRYGELGDSRLRGELLERAESLAFANRATGQVAEIRCNMADNLRTQGRYKEAWSVLDGADSLLRRTSEPGAEAGCLQLRAMLAQETGRNQESGLAIRRAIAIKDSLGETRDMAYLEMLTTLAGALRSEGHMREAHAAYQRAAAVMDSTGRGGTVARNIAQHDRALALIELGETAEAERLLHGVLERMVQGDRSGWIHWQPLVHYAETALAQGHADSALKYFGVLYAQAVRDTNQYWQGRGSFGLARAQVELGRLADARRTSATFRRVSANYPHVKDTDDQIPDSQVLDGRLALAVGDATAAHASFVAALRSNGYFEGKRKEHLRPVVLLAAETALSLGKLDTALVYARQARAIATLDSLTETGSARVGEARLIEARSLLARGDTSGGQRALDLALLGLRNGAGDRYPRTREARDLLQALPASLLSPSQ